MTNYSQSVLKSNGLRHPKNLPVKFGFTLKNVSANIAKKLPSQRCPNRFSSHFSTFRTNGPRLLSRAKVGTHSALLKGSHTTAHTAKQGPSLPRPQRGFALPVKFFYSATLLYTYISRFSVNPHYQQQFYLRPSFIALFNFSHKRPTFAFTGESGYTLGFRRRIAHSSLHAETGGVSDGGGITTLGAFRTFTNIPGPGIRTASFAAFGAWSGVLPKNAESLRNSDALMRVAVPRRRGPAGLRDLFATW